MCIVTIGKKTRFRGLAPETLFFEIVQIHWEPLSKQRSLRSPGGWLNLKRPLMKLLISDHSKILAFIALGKLEKAFDLAVSCADEVDVELIKKHAQATKSNQDLVRKCEEYLRDHSRLRDR